MTTDHERNTGSGVLASVVIPTYNRAALLDGTLRSLARQDIDPARFEVLIGDDGSSDETDKVVAEYRGDLTLGYYRQEDLGFRAAAARNLAAAHARGAIIVLLDSGNLVPPWFVRAHLAAHQDGRRAVLGYVYGYNKEDADQRVTAEQWRQEPPEQLIARMRAERRQLDQREENFESVGDDLGAMVAPWVFFWTANVSLPTQVYRALGGFDEEFVGWGGEDIEFARRLFTSGLPFVLARQAAAIECPHPRDRAANRASHVRNQALILRKHTEPVLEAATVIRARVLEGRLRELSAALAERRQGLEIAGVPAVGTGHSRARTLWIGIDQPGIDPAPGSVCLEPDPQLIHRSDLVPGRQVQTQTSYGFRTLYPDLVFEQASVSTSLRVLPDWARDLLLVELGRVAGTVRWSDGVSFEGPR